MPKILIIAPSWVGDAVMVQPLIALLRQKYAADLKLDVFASPWVAPVFKRMAHVNEVILNPFQHGSLALGARRALGKKLQTQAYQQAIILPNSLKSALLPFWANIPKRTGFLGEMRYFIVNDLRHLDKEAMPLLIERFCSLACAPSDILPRPVPYPRLIVDYASQRASLEKLNLTFSETRPKRPVVIFCPGAEYGDAKRWPVEHFAQLAIKLIQDGKEIWILGSAKDEAIGQAITKYLPLDIRKTKQCINLCGQTDLIQAIDLLAVANFVVTNDSGLMHIAAAVGTPLIALFGSSSPLYTPPLARQAQIASLHLSCSPCFKRSCPLKHFDCMMKLTPDNVFAKLKQLERAMPPVA